MGVAIAAGSVFVAWILLAGYFEFKNRQADKNYIKSNSGDIENK